MMDASRTPASQTFPRYNILIGKKIAEVKSRKGTRKGTRKGKTKTRKAQTNERTDKKRNNQSNKQGNKGRKKQANKIIKTETRQTDKHSSSESNWCEDKKKTAGEARQGAIET